MTQQIIRSIGSDGKEVLSNILDKDTGKLIEFKEVSEYYDGTSMSDDKLDIERYLYIKNNGKYYLRVIDNPDKFLEKDTMLDMRNISNTEILLLKMGYYRGITLNGYYEKGDTPGAIDYYISATSASDDGGSVIAVGGVKLGHEFNNEVNVLYFGVSENISDNKSSIDIAITYCESLTLQTHENSVKLLFPYTSKGYRTTGGHKIGRYIDVVMEGMVIDITTSSNITFEIGDATIAGANPNRKHLIRIRRLNENRSNFVDENDIGVILHNEYYSNSIVDYVRGFGIGFRLGGSGFGSSYNKYTLGLIASNYIGVDLYSTGTGWVNENTFYGGEFTVYSYLKSNQKIGVRSHAEGIYYNNSNLFLKPSFEGYDNNEVPGSYTVQMTGRYNKVMDARHEIGRSIGEMIAVKELGELTGENTYHFSYCDSFPLIDSEYPNQNSIVEVHNGDFQYKTVKLYDSGNIASKIWVSQGKWWANDFSFCSFNTGALTNDAGVGGGMTIVDNKYITTYECPAVVVDTSSMKKISYDLVSDIGFTKSRVYFKLYDASDVEITDITAIKGGGTRLTSFGGCFGASQNLFPYPKGLRNVAFSDIVKKVVVIFSGDRLRNFSIYTSDLKHGAVYSGLTNYIPTPSDYNKVKIITNTDYVLSSSDEIIEFQGLTANRVVTLPATSTLPIGKRFTIKASGANSFSVSVNGGIEGVSSVILNSQYSTLTVYSNGTVWRFLNSYVLATPTTKGLVSQATASADIATQATGATPTKAEFDALLAELRDVKTKLRTAGTLAPNTP